MSEPERLATIAARYLATLTPPAKETTMTDAYGHYDAADLALPTGASNAKTEPRYPDVKALTPLETQHITAECRDNHSMMLAFHYAKEALWQVYRAQVEHNPGVTVSLAIYVTDPQTPQKSGPPSPPKPPRLPRGWAVG